MTRMYSQLFIILFVVICFLKHVVKGRGFVRITDKTPTPYRLLVGGKFSLTCVYNGETAELVDSCQLQFCKDGDKIPVGKEYRTYMAQDGNEISFTIISNRNNGLEMQDGGKYECRYRTIKFQKYVEIFDVDSTVTVTNETNKEWKKNVEIKCEAIFSMNSSRVIDNRYSIEWYKDETPIEEVKSLDGRYTEGYNNITIHNVVKEDMGTYQCVFVFTDNNDRINHTVFLKGDFGDFRSSNVVKFESVTFIRVVMFFCWLYDYTWF